MDKKQIEKKRKVIYKVHIFDRQNLVTAPRGIRLDIRRVCHAVLSSEHFDHSAEVNVVFVDNAHIQQLNKQYRGKDVPTDTLSFPSGKDEYEINQETGAKILGDIVLSIEKANNQPTIVVVKPKCFSNAVDAADQLKQRHPIILDVTALDTDEAKRTVDFISGTVYGVNGDVQKVSSGIFIATPASFEISGDYLKGKAGAGLDWSMFK